MSELSQEQRKQILDAIHAIQDADGCILGLPVGETGSEVMRLHRVAVKALLQALGLWKGEF